MRVEIEDERTGEVTASQTLGPLIVEKRGADGSVQKAWRPIFLHQAKGEKISAHLFYPLLSWQRDGDYSFFTFFQVINNRRSVDGHGVPQHGFDVWPFYFSRDTGDPATSYRALLPIAGTIKHRFGKEELNWTIFPLYFHTQAKGRHTRYTPWPFIRQIDGAGHRGFEFWPLFGQRGRDGDYREQFYLWPLIYKQEKNLSEPTPDVKFGFLPFYTRDTGPGYIDENYLWPFFGYSDRVQPKRYRETRYFWPLFVQGRGDERHVNRWAPFYTNSVVKGYDKTWLLFPLVRHAEWQDPAVAHERNQFLYFLYWSHEQRSLANPSAAPAYKKHLWPLLSVWDNGAGRRQFQLLSPLEVFFPHNEPIRQLYSPLFAIFRHDRRAPDDVRWSFLWSLVSRTRTPTEREFHLGPLFSTRTAGGASRVALGSGLLSWRREAGEARWRFSLFDFRRTSANHGHRAASP
ncbi:MAG: hypothetical protein C0518_03260 [Opitutus sp.]|nr:hypothetical protein [Opitutus sp.]